MRNTLVLDELLIFANFSFKNRAKIKQKESLWGLFPKRYLQKHKDVKAAPAVSLLFLLRLESPLLPKGYIPNTNELKRACLRNPFYNIFLKRWERVLPRARYKKVLFFGETCALLILQPTGLPT